MNQTASFKQTTDDERARIAAARIEGKTTREIAAELNRSQSTISRRLQDDEIRDMIDRERRALAGYATEAREVLVDTMRQTDDRKLRYDASKTVLQSTGILPSHTPSPFILNLYQDNRTVESHVWNVLSDKMSEMLPPPDNDKDIVDVSPDAGPDEPRAQGK